MDIDFEMYDAAENGDMNLIQEMLRRGARNYNMAMYGAAYGGHMDIVQLMLALGANQYDITLEAAAEEGHMDIVQEMLRRGATDYGNALYKAACNGNIDIVRLLLNLGGETFYEDAIQHAIRCGGFIDIVQLILEYGELDFYAYNYLIEEAVRYGYSDIAELLTAYRNNNEDMKRYYKAIAARYSLNKKHEQMVQKHSQRFIEKNEAYRLAPKLTEDTYDQISQFLYGSRRSRRRSKR